MMTRRSKATPEERRLLELLPRLGPQQRATLVDFAEFLASRAEAAAPAEPEPLPEPRPEPRPESESVIAAIKRLSRTYPMLDKSEMLNETSSLMTQHVMQGREAGEVIDELEAVFAQAYERLRAERGG